MKIKEKVKSIAICPSCGSAVDAWLIDTGDTWDARSSWIVACDCGRQTNPDETYETSAGAVKAFFDKRRVFHV